MGSTESDAKTELTRSWLVKAYRDLLSAEKLGNVQAPLLDTAAYHCQQTAEKAIKAFLLFHDIRFEKTHDIEALILQASTIDPDFADHLDDGQILTPFATEFRYPGEFLEPDPDEFAEAYQTASEFYHFVLSKLPPQTHPL